MLKPGTLNFEINAQIKRGVASFYRQACLTPVTLGNISLFLFISFVRPKEMNQRKGRRK